MSQQSWSISNHNSQLSRDLENIPLESKEWKKLMELKILERLKTL